MPAPSCVHFKQPSPPFLNKHFRKVLIQPASGEEKGTTGSVSLDRAQGQGIPPGRPAFSGYRRVTVKIKKRDPDTCVDDPA